MRFVSVLFGKIDHTWKHYLPDSIVTGGKGGSVCRVRHLDDLLKELREKRKNKVNQFEIIPLT